MQADKEEKRVYAYETALSRLTKALDFLYKHRPFSDAQQDQLQDEILAIQQSLQVELSSEKPMPTPMTAPNEPPQESNSSTLTEGVETLSITLAKDFGRALRDDEKQLVQWTLGMRI